MKLGKFNPKTSQMHQHEGLNATLHLRFIYNLQMKGNICIKLKILTN